MQQNLPSLFSPSSVSRVSFLNTHTLNGIGRPELLVQRLEQQGISVCGLAETHWPGNGMAVYSGWTFYYSGLQTSSIKQHGVGLATKPGVQQSLLAFKPISERLLVANFKLHTGKKLSLIVAYAPTEDKPDSVKDRFYSDLQQQCSSVPKNHQLLLMGDFNAQLGEDVQLWQGVTGRSCVGNTTSGNGRRLLQFCAINSLTVLNTLFQHKLVHTWTWCSPDGVTKNQIDYIICSQRLAPSVHDCRVFRGAEFQSDHRLLVASVKLRLCRSRLQPKQPRLQLELLRDVVVQEEFMVQVQRKYDSLPQEKGACGWEWEQFRDGVSHVSVQVLSAKREPRKPWILEGTMKLAEDKQAAFLKWQRDKSTVSRQEYRHLVNATRKSLRADKQAWLHIKADLVETAAKCNNQRSLFHELKQLQKPERKPIAGLRNAEGFLVFSDSEKRDTFAVHFSKVLNCHRTVDATVFDDVEPYGPSLDADDPPSIEEITDAVKRAKNHKACGVDRIYAEQLKAGSEVLVPWLKRVFDVVWASGQVPKDWTLAELVPLFKKHDMSIPDNFRGITLLSVPGKVFAYVLLGRLQGWAEHQLLECQCGFRPGRGCGDALFVIRGILERAWEANVPLYICFIDLAKAYDSVDRETAWKVLECKGVSPKLVQMLRGLHSDTTCVVRAFDGTSEPFQIHTGFKQGCVLAPTLFNIFIDTIARQILRIIEGHSGIKLIYKIDGQLRISKNPDLSMIIWILMYADDIALFSDNAESLEVAAQEVHQKMKQWGMPLGVKKCKVLVVSKSDDVPQPVIVLDGEQLEVVKKFEYLGSMFTHDNNLDTEISHRISRAAMAFASLRGTLWGDRRISLHTKVRIFNAVVMSSLLYGSESWAALDSHVRRLEVFQMQCLRMICGISRRLHMSNEVILVKCDQPLVAAKLTEHRLRWLGHVGRMGDERVPKRVLFGKIMGGKRSRGRPRVSWADVVTKDLQTRKIGKWFKLCQDRHVWRRIVRG